MGQASVHPMFLTEEARMEKANGGSEEVGADRQTYQNEDQEEKEERDMLSQIRNFRPPHTILEVKAREKGSERYVEEELLFIHN
jgi:hypothetical protein